VADLCTLVEYKAAIGAQTVGQRDEMIQEAITAASALLAVTYEREWVAPTPATLTRRFPVVDGVIDLAPHDARSIDSIVLDPDGAGTPVAPSDIQALPLPSVHGVTTHLELVDTPPATVADVTGTWGFATVPVIVRRACIETVRAMTRADPGRYGAGMSDDARPGDAAPPGAYAIPPVVRQWLDPFRRYGSIA
jgi:hypothetical protein